MAHTILVPFAPESRSSGIGDTGFHRACWYEREFEYEKPTEKPGEKNLVEKKPCGDKKPGRVILHFGAVDYLARVWVNNMLAIEHEGGHTPFSVDITMLLSENSTQRITVRAEDDPEDLEKPRGKQDWQQRRGFW